MSDIEQLEAAFPPTPAQPRTEIPEGPSQAVTANYEEKLGTLGKKWHNILDLPGGQGYSSASEADMALIDRLTKCNFTAGEIWRTLEGSARLADRIQRKGEKHARDLYAREIEKAQREVVPFPEREPEAQHVAKEHLAETSSASVNGDRPSDTPPPDLSRLPDACYRLITEDYLRAVDGVTEASDTNHYFTILCVAGAVLGRRVYFHLAYDLYPNIYLLCIGPPGVSRKTTTQRLATDVGERADPTLKIIRSSGSGEGLLEVLASADTTESQPNPIHNRVLLVQSEMAQLLAKGRQEGTGTLIPILLDAYDAPPVINPPTRANKINAQKPTLSMMGASTTSQLQKYMQGHEVYGGFVSRLMVTVGEPKAPIPLPKKMDGSRLNRIVEVIHDAADRFRGPTQFTMSAEAEDAYKAFYLAWRARQLTLGDRADIVSRTPSHAIKLGLLFAALENETPTIELGQIEAGIAAAEFAQESALQVFGDFGISKTVALENRMVEKVAKTPGVTQRQLQQYVGGHADARTFRQHLDALLNTQKLTETDGGFYVGD